MIVLRGTCDGSWFLLCGRLCHYACVIRVERHATFHNILHILFVCRRWELFRSTPRMMEGAGPSSQNLNHYVSKVLD